jgi:ABC-type amino acid transport substrate-binding protein
LAGDVAKARQELASTGKLRVGVVSAPKADAFFVVKNADDRPRGVTVDLGDELARTLNVSSEFFVAHNSGEITDALENGLIDVAFMPVDDERRKRVEFGPAYYYSRARAWCSAAPILRRSAISIGRVFESAAKPIRPPFAALRGRSS